MEIIFIRHGPPEFKNSRWLHRSDLEQLLADYKACRMVSAAPADLLSMLFAISDRQVFCSELPRSIDSAAALGFADARQISELNEADIPSPNWLRIPIPYKVAVIGLRLAWFLGYSGVCDSYRTTLERAEVAAEKLTEVARVHGSVLVVGHGVMNQLVSSRLKNSGWSADDRGPTGYWSVIRVTKLPSIESRGDAS